MLFSTAEGRWSGEKVNKEEVKGNVRDHPITLLKARDIFTNVFDDAGTIFT